MKEKADVNKQILCTFLKKKFFTIAAVKFSRFRATAVMNIAEGCLSPRCRRGCSYTARILEMLFFIIPTYGVQVGNQVQLSRPNVNGHSVCMKWARWLLLSGLATDSCQ